MNIWQSITGMLDVQLTSAELKESLMWINTEGIEIYQIKFLDELSCCFRVYRKDYQRLKRKCQKRGEKLQILRRSGLYWAVKSLAARPVMLIGGILMLLLMTILPGRILFVHVEGNHAIPTNEIIEAAEHAGIEFGTKRKEIRSERVKNALLSAIPQLQWVGVNTAGCVATVSVRERSENQSAIPQQVVTNIVAARDGYILSGTVTQGNGVFQVGETVRAGQILISGYTDCGFCIRASRAEGEIFAETSRHISAVMPLTVAQKSEFRERKRKISLVLRKKRINLWKDSGISCDSCDRIYREYTIPLPGGFSFPITLCVETFLFYTSNVEEVLSTEAEHRLQRFSDAYLLQQMVAGEILQRSCSIRKREGSYYMESRYTCTEMIGREQREQIGETNGKTG